VTDAAYDAYNNHNHNHNGTAIPQHLQDGLLSPPTNGNPNDWNHQRHRSSWTPFRWLWTPWTTNHPSNHDRHHPNNNNNNAYFAEFGIPDLDPENHHNNYSNHHFSLVPNHNQSNNNNKNEYIHLPTDPRLFPSPENEGWASIADLDVYFQSIYNYYYHRGWIPILTRGITEIITIYFTFLFSILLFVFIDWSHLSSCIDETSCQSNFMQHYIQRRPFRKHFWSLYNLWIILYIVIFGIYCIITLVSFLHTIQIAIRTKYIYEEKLGISARKLMNGAIDWDRDIVQKLIALQESGQYRIVIPNTTARATTSATRTHQERPKTDISGATIITTDRNNATANDVSNELNDQHPTSAATSSNTLHPHHDQQQQHQHNLSALMIANRILRKENFMIALFNRQILNLSIFPKNHRYQYSNQATPRFFCSSLEVRHILV
jgi:Autophagy protein ATG9